MEYIRTITLDISGQESIPTVPAKQGDIQARTITCILANQQEPFKIPPTAIARIAFRKPDGKQVLNDCTIVDNMVRVELTEQMLTSSGKANCEVMIFNNPSGQLLTSATFSVMIYPVSYNSDLIESSYEYKSFLQALLNIDIVTDRCEYATLLANAAAENADNAALNANNAADTALQEANHAKEASATALKSASLADLAADRANDAADRAEETIRGNIYLIDPTLGQSNLLQDILFNLYTYFIVMLGNPISAGEFDSVLVTVDEFDNKSLTVREFDEHAKDHFTI